MTDDEKTDEETEDLETEETETEDSETEDNETQETKDTETYLPEKTKRKLKHARIAMFISYAGIMLPVGYLVLTWIWNGFEYGVDWSLTVMGVIVVILSFFTIKKAEREIAEALG